MFARVESKAMALFALIIVAGMLLSACGPSTPEVVVETEEVEVTREVETVVTATPEPETEGEAESGTDAELGDATLTVGIPAGFDRLDPNVTTFSRVLNMTMHMTDPLVWKESPGVYVPGLATEWEVNDDATEYRFKLREDVTFHDGTPFNAEAVKFTFDRIVDPETKSQSAFSNIGPYEETEIVNDYEVIVRFETGYAPFLDMLSGGTLVPVSPAAQKEVGNEDWGLTDFVGTGPYMFESMELDQEVVMVRNPDYNWGPEFTGRSGPPEIERIVYRFVPEPATRTAALVTDEIQFMDQTPENEFLTLKEDPDFETVELPQPGSGWALMFNHQNPPTDQLPVRRALQLAMDRQGMIDTVFNGFGTPACSPLTQVVFCYDPATCDMYDTDLDEAEQTLEDAGWIDSNGDGVRERDGEDLVVTYYYRADTEIGQGMAAFLKDNFAKIGVEVDLQGLSRSGYFDAVRAGEHNMQPWWETGTDPDMVRTFFHSSNAGGGTNRNNYIDEEMDQMIDEAAAEPDPEKRCELYSEIQKKVKDEAIMEFWSDPVILYAHSAGLSGVTYYQGGNTPYFYASSLEQ